jgi:NADPH2:quinone reductase
MRAAVITSFGGPEVLAIREVPRPVPADADVLVRVRTAGVNRADVHQRRGGYAAPAGSPTDIPGIEFAGEIAALGAAVTSFRIGDRVFGIAGGGTHAEFVIVPAETIVAMPASLDWPTAGAVPESFITAHDALIEQARLVGGERVLIHAVGSSVGLAAVQIARAVGAVPYGTSRTHEKIERAEELGLADGVEVLDDFAPLTARVMEWTGNRGVDVVLDLAGGPYTAASLRMMATRGRLMLVGLVAGAEARVDLRRVLSARLTIIGTMLRHRSIVEKAAASRAFARDVLPWLTSGLVKPVIDRVYSLDDIAEAHRHMESNASFGKIVLSI